MHNIKLSGAADNALSKLQDTTLNPMEEALFKAWTKANQIEKPDSPDNNVDLRGIFHSSDGMVLPHGVLKRMMQESNNEMKLEKVLQQQLMDNLAKSKDAAKNAKDMAHKEARQDITHKQKMDMESLKLKRLPHDAKMKEHDVQAKHAEIEKQRVGNEGKQIDLVKSVFAPQGAGNAAGQARTINA